jgi:hypothetical protein
VSASYGGKLVQVLRSSQPKAIGVLEFSKEALDQGKALVVTSSKVSDREL